MVLDPYLMLARLFSTWFRLRFLMGFTIIWCIILLGLSGWMTEADGGSFSGFIFPSNKSYNSWSNFCDSAPYSYLSPFQFSYTTEGGDSSSTDAICPWPANNSDLRFTITVISMVNLAVLFIKTPISLFARWMLAGYALLFFSSFVIDAYASTTGLAYCNSRFSNTELSADMESVGMSVTCNSSNFSGVVVIDLLISALFFVMHTAWGLTTDLYVDKNLNKEAKKSDRGALLKSMA